MMINVWMWFVISIEHLKYSCDNQTFKRSWIHIFFGGKCQSKWQFVLNYNRQHRRSNKTPKLNQYINEHIFKTNNWLNKTWWIENEQCKMYTKYQTISILKSQINSNHLQIEAIWINEDTKLIEYTNLSFIHASEFDKLHNCTYRCSHIWLFAGQKFLMYVAQWIELLKWQITKVMHKWDVWICSLALKQQWISEHQIHNQFWFVHKTSLS